VSPLRRALRVAVFLALATATVAPVLPGAPGVAVASVLRHVSVLQTWNMYAPDPVRAHSHLSVSAELADGSRVPLDEALQAERAWGTVRDWEKRRTDMWRFYAVVRPDEANAFRTWYLRSLCVREDRLRGEPPVRIVAERLRRAFNPPEAVAAGQPTLGVMTRDPVMTVSCRQWPERAMVAADRERRGLPFEDPRPKLGRRRP
jgi:hypothetical protein